MGRLRWDCIGILMWIPGALLAQTAPIDKTLDLQGIIDSLPANGVLDCGNQRYVVTSLRPKSNMTIQNCQLETAPVTMDLAAPITIDGRTEAKNQILIYNVQVKGDRHTQSQIGATRQEDGGRHCFRLLGRVSDVVIDSSSGTYCATDGIALISYGVSVSDDPGELPFRNITIRNSDFSFNRRHGASADGIHNVAFDNVSFTQNGTTLPGGSEGDQCASSGGNCYGTGFWYEDYLPGSGGEGLNGLVFSRCIFRGNYQRSIYFIDVAQPSSPGFQPRQNVRILNSYLDAGAQPLAEDYGLQFQAEDTVAQGTALFQDVAILNSVLDGAVGFRHVDKVLMDSSQVDTTIDYLGYAAYSTNLIFQNVDASGKLLSATFNLNGQGVPAVSYSTSPTGLSTLSTRPRSGRNTPHRRSAL